MAKFHVLLETAQIAPRFLSTSPRYGHSEIEFEHVFFETIHPRWPLLNRSRYEAVFDRQYTPRALSITEESILHLIYAITARFLAVTRKPCGVDDEVSPQSFELLVAPC